MTDEQAQPPQQGEMRIDVADQDVGVFADFVSLWNTPNTFVLDFVTLKAPVTEPTDGEVAHLDARVAARVRLPAEQVYPLIEALRKQADAWLSATGRTEPPETWFPSSPPARGKDDTPRSQDN